MLLVHKVPLRVFVLRTTLIAVKSNASESESLSTEWLNLLLSSWRNVGINIVGGGMVDSDGVLLVSSEQAQQAVAKLQNRGFDTRIR